MLSIRILLIIFLWSKYIIIVRYILNTYLYRRPTVALLITFNHGYRCFKCFSTQEPGCGDPFNPSAPGIKIVEAKQDELCWVISI